MKYGKKIFQKKTVTYRKNAESERGKVKDYESQLHLREKGKMTHQDDKKDDKIVEEQASRFGLEKENQYNQGQGGEVNKSVG